MKVNMELLFEAMKYSLVESLKNNCPQHDGDLKRSIRAINNDEKLQIYALNYAWYVEKGTAPHWTSVENLKKWAKDKWGDEKLAYALQRHIALYGTRPHEFIRKTFKKDFKKILKDGLQTEGVITFE
ncbi:MAG: hypothetical protein EOL95_10480 [Bacteroidia bacterium]|nr:hypothetical protein [Bacteroidia bacterium]